MSKFYLSIGYDDEKPYGKLAESPEGKIIRERNLLMSKKIIETLDTIGAPRTFFILGNYLERCLDDFSMDYIREIYCPKNKLTEIGQHTYSHCIVKNIFGREDKKVLSPEEFEVDLKKAKCILENILVKTPKSIRMPLGYDKDLSDLPEILSVLNKLGMEYVSSNLRENNSINATLSTKRQPHFYSNVGFPNLLEIPSHGWADAVFTKDYCNRYYNKDPQNFEEMLNHYKGLITLAENLSRDISPIFISFCLHPWAVMEYDKDLEAHKKIVDYTRALGGDIIPYQDIQKKLKYEKTMTGKI